MNYLRSQLSRPSRWVGRALAPFWNRRNLALNEAALPYLSLEAGERLLEIGFGGGYLLEHLQRCWPEAELFGADWSVEMVAFTARRVGRTVRLLRASVQALPYPGGFFSHVVSVNSIFYWPDAHSALVELNRVTIPGGRLVLVFTDRASLQKRGFARRGLNLYDGETVSGWLREIGFGPVTAIQSADRHRIFWVVVAQKGPQVK